MVGYLIGGIIYLVLSIKTAISLVNNPFVYTRTDMSINIKAIIRWSLIFIFWPVFAIVDLINIVINKWLI